MITCIMHYSDACGEHFCEEQQLDANVESPLNEMTRNFLEKVNLPILGRSVRMETASFMAVLAPMAGRTLAKALKSLAGPWWLAQADPDPDCSSTFKAAFLEVFPAAKQREALTFCRNQVTVYCVPEIVLSQHRSYC